MPIELYKANVCLKPCLGTRTSRITLSNIITITTGMIHNGKIRVTEMNLGDRAGDTTGR